MKVPFFTWFLLLSLLTILFEIDVALVSGVCQSDQQSLLVQLSKSLSFNQTKSSKLVNWNSSADCCDWAGVTCDEDGLGRVIGLNLSNESISGGLDTANALFSLEYLQHLDLSYNNFNTSLPERFANLTSVSSLNLSNAGFVGQIPEAISRMISLVFLDLSSNIYFSGNKSMKLENPNLATLVQGLTLLKELHLDGLNLSAQGDEWCQALSTSLPHLQVLSLSNCFLSGPIHPSLAKLQSLSIIRLDNNNLSAPVPDFFANFSNLRILRFSSCDLQGTFPANVFKVSTLEILDLSYNQELEGNLPDSLHNSSLKTLVLSNTKFSGSLPESVGALVNLSRIELGSCSFTGAIPSSMANLTQLIYLDFSSNMFTGQIPSFQKSKNIFYVDLSHNRLSGEIPFTHWEGHQNLSYIDLRNNSLSGSIPSSLFAIPSLQKVQLSLNQLGGQLPDLSNVSLSLLDTLDLSSNKLEGLIPNRFFDLKRLNVLLLSSNKFNGTIQLDRIQKLSNLTRLDLSYNYVTVESAASSSLSSYPQLNTLKLASCNLSKFPDLSNQSKLIMLDLSENQITGLVPRWIWKVGNGSPVYLNLSHNHLDGLERPYSIPSLAVLDLHSNRLKGRIPNPPPFVTYVDYSNNKFASVIPDDIGKNLLVAIFFSLSNNRLTGVIPKSICNATSLQVLDLSNNDLNGELPACLIERSENLGVLNLRRNRFNSSIPNNFPRNCKLKTLDVSGNLLEGPVPQSLINCAILEVLDLGSNKINDGFPCLLRNISSLRALVLRNNAFQGSLHCPQKAVKWSKLQIVDIASNKFSGPLPNTVLTKWKAMMQDGNETHDHLKFEVLRLDHLYYQDSITVTSKGLEMNLVKILTVFTCIDVSNNKFEGRIPEKLGQLNALYVLNLSRNALEGQIPPSLGNISHLESLDLSDNNLTGVIPEQLANLNFLSVLNLSHNMLFGKIPRSTQLQTFSEDSFADNAGLCGAPLSDNCSDTNASPTEQQKNPRNEFDWQFIVPGIGFGLGAGAVVAPLMFSKKLNKCYDRQIDKILKVLLPMLGLIYYASDDWRIAPEETFEEDATDDDDDDEEEYDFGGRYCVFCTKLDITRKRAIHDPKCTCHHSSPISFTSSSSLSSSASS
ncbi:receptor-like protein 33 [Jatropha curcas]|uniref:receptor-like protein 33 n=1 Tax=Jatropha curcas TaxID=180498 RepID=UPI0018950A1D|nr:receptor-like protein 33 [Jatropha curcas]